MLRIGVASILILISVGCSNDYILEDQFCDCYREYAITISEDFDALVQKIEQHYLEAGILQSAEGTSYYKNVELLAQKSKNYNTAHSLLNFEGIQSEMAQLSQVRDNSNCNYLKSSANEGSRILQLNNSALIELGKGTLLESVWEIHANELTAKDYDHIFFKADYFIVDYAMFLADFSEMSLFPLKVDFPDPEPLPVEERNVFGIITDSNDDLLANGKAMEIADLYSEILSFYQANIDGKDNDLDMPLYHKIDKTLCQTTITALEKELAFDALDNIVKSDLIKWKTKLELTTFLEGGFYMEIDNGALIQLDNSAGTSYGFYIEIQNIIKQVVNELRVSKCAELGWPDYFDLEWNKEEDQFYLKMLRILVPERIVELELMR